MILKDKVVIVTGAGPGMGQAMCRGAAAEGAKVVVSARSVPAIEALAHEIIAGGGEAIAVPCDVASMDQCQALAAAAMAKWGRIDGMVHSAYYHPDWGSLLDHSLDQVTRALDVIALGGLRMAKAVVPQMKAQGAGSIVNISTLATRKPMPGEGGCAPPWMVAATTVRLHTGTEAERRELDPGAVGRCLWGLLPALAEGRSRSTVWMRPLCRMRSAVIASVFGKDRKASGPGNQDGGEDDQQHPSELSIGKRPVRMHYQHGHQQRGDDGQARQAREHAKRNQQRTQRF